MDRRADGETGEAAKQNAAAEAAITVSAIPVSAITIAAVTAVIPAGITMTPAVASAMEPAAKSMAGVSGRRSAHREN